MVAQGNRRARVLLGTKFGYVLSSSGGGLWPTVAGELIKRQRKRGGVIKRVSWLRALASCDGPCKDLPLWLSSAAQASI